MRLATDKGGLVTDVTLWRGGFAEEREALVGELRLGTGAWGLGKSYEWHPHVQRCFPSFNPAGVSRLPHKEPLPPTPRTLPPPPHTAQPS